MIAMVENIPARLVSFGLDLNVTYTSRDLTEFAGVREPADRETSFDGSSLRS